MNTRFQISSQRGQCSLWSGTQSGPSERCAPRSKWISLHGPQGPGLGHPPEVLVVAVVDVAPAGHPLRRQADLVPPDGPRLLVIGVGGGGEAIGRDAHVTRQEVPGPMDGVTLEVVPEAPVAEHLEQGVVPGRAADLLEVVVLARHPQASLHVHGAGVRALLDAPEHVLELDHATVGEQQRLVSRRHQAGAGHDGVAALGEVLEEPATDLVGRQRGDPGVVRRPVVSPETSMRVYRTAAPASPGLVACAWAVLAAVAPSASGVARQASARDGWRSRSPCVTLDARVHAHPTSARLSG